MSQLIAAKPPAHGSLPSLRQLIIGTHNEMAMELKVLKLSGGASGPFAKIQRDLALAKHDNPRDKASASVGLFWRNRAKFKTARVRMDALLKIQEDMLIAAVTAIERDAQTKARDARVKAAHAQQAAPTENKCPPPAPVVSGRLAADNSIAAASTTTPLPGPEIKIETHDLTKELTI